MENTDNTDEIVYNIKKRVLKIGGIFMRVAITNNGKNVAEQFGKAISFTVYEVAKGKTKGKIVINVSASGGSDALLFILKNEGVEVLLCGQISEQMKVDLENYGIEVVDGLRGNVNALLRAYLMGRIKGV